MAFWLLCQEAQLRAVGFVQLLVKVPGILSRKIPFLPWIVELAGWVGWLPGRTAWASWDKAR